MQPFAFASGLHRGRGSPGLVVPESLIVSPSLKKLSQMMSNETPKAPTEKLRAEIHELIRGCGGMTVCETVGVLELVKADMWEQLRACEHPDAQKP